MTLLESMASLDSPDPDSDAVAAFIATLDTDRLQVLNDLVYQELVLRYEGKPLDKSRLH